MRTRFAAVSIVRELVLSLTRLSSRFSTFQGLVHPTAGSKAIGRVTRCDALACEDTPDRGNTTTHWLRKEIRWRRSDVACKFHFLFLLGQRLVDELCVNLLGSPCILPTDKLLSFLCCTRTMTMRRSFVSGLAVLSQDHEKNSSPRAFSALVLLEHILQIHNGSDRGTGECNWNRKWKRFSTDCPTRPIHHPTEFTAAYFYATASNDPDSISYPATVCHSNSTVCCSTTPVVFSSSSNPTWSSSPRSPRSSRWFFFRRRKQEAERHPVTEAIVQVLFLRLINISVMIVCQILVNSIQRCSKIERTFWMLDVFATLTCAWYCAKKSIAVLVWRKNIFSCDQLIERDTFKEREGAVSVRSVRMNCLYC